MAKKKQNAIPGEEFFDQFQIKDQEPYRGPSADEGKKAKEAAESGSDAKIEELSKTIAVLNDRLERVQQAQMVGSGNFDTPRVPEAPVLSFDDLPDAVEDPEGYQKEVAKRVSEHNVAYQDYVDQRNKASAATEQRGEQLWNTFRTKYPEISENQKRVEFATNEVLEGAMSRGVDINKYVYGTQDAFFKDVADKYGEIFGAEDKSGDDDGKDGKDDEPTRTGGLPGGQESGGKSSAGGSSDDEAGDMMNEVRELQVKDGIL